jgi:asparagine synthase (glutamine-hydrolysing)
LSALAGLWCFDGNPGAAEGCARMLAAQEIYGPHDGRQWSGGDIALGRRLYRTLPEDAFDLQPLSSADDRLVLAADVRLDNRDELCAALGIAAAQARELCDAAVLLAALERWGEAALDRLVGDFAFALWDSRARKLVLARDFLGQRPLYYHAGKGFFAFATMARGLHALPEIPRQPDEQAVAEFVALIPQAGPRSFYQDIARVEPGHVVTVTREGVTSRRYWNPQRADPAASGREDYVEGLRHHLDEAARARLRGAGQAVATHLSAGFDSAAVTATAARLTAASGGKVVAFTAVPREGYDGPCPKDRIGDEGPLAAATAALHPNVEHVLVRSGHRSPVADLDRSFQLFDRPITNPCNWVWLAAIASAARERTLSVLLTGQMGNMTLSYAGLEFLPELLAQGRLAKWCRVSSQLVSSGRMRWRGVLATSFGPFLPSWLWRRVRRGKLDLRVALPIRPDLLESWRLRDLAEKRGLDFSLRPRKNAFETRLWVMNRTDQGNFNKGWLAGWGLDYRDPTADARLAEFCLQAPMEAYVAGGETRLLARRALADRLPQAVLDDRSKGLQGVDWHEGLNGAREDVRTELNRLSHCDPAARILDIERLRSLVDSWPKDGWSQDDIMWSYRLALLRGVATGHFLRKASGSNA